MRKMFAVAAMAASLSVPAQAGEPAGGADVVRAGAFVGARVRLSLGAGARREVRAVLTLAPTRSYRGDTGRAVTRIGEGVAIDFASRRPTLMLGGAPVGAAWRLRPERAPRAERKLGLSTGAWIGIGAVVTVAAVVAVTQLTCVGKDPDYCGSD